MNGLDYLFLAVIGFSALVAVLRGFVREIVGLVGWVAAVAAASLFSKHLEGLMAPWVDTPLLASLFAYVLLFAGTLLIFSILGRVVKKLVGGVGLTLFDRLAGLIFGLLRGVVVLVLAIMVYLSLDGPSNHWTQQSFLFQLGRQGAFHLAGFLPKGSVLSEKIITEVPKSAPFSIF